MEVALITIATLVCLSGLVGILAALSRPSERSDQLLRWVCGARLHSDRSVALPFSAMLFFTGLAMALLPLRTAPMWLLAVITVLGFVSSVIAQLRRTDV
jgi:hypothetical protein